ncbi:hypothetical protein Syun_020865 [Stephania yunnanensis]|uniref:Retrotransposon Copia-like N-terminal domain-containing protein n=1 Tax=Stephania yunnanensis TaxID=152371 RepID=A0AAP0NP98_9MAGN
MNVLNGKNYLGWSRSMKMALGAKMKTSFIDGRCPKPAETSPHFDQWIKVDLMILEEEKVHRLLTIGEYPLYIVPLDEDVLLFELDLAYRVC